MGVRCRKCTRCKTTLLPLLSFSYYRLSMVVTRLMCKIRRYLNGGILDSILCSTRVGSTSVEVVTKSIKLVFWTTRKLSVSRTSSRTVVLISFQNLHHNQCFHSSIVYLCMTWNNGCIPCFQSSTVCPPAWLHVNMIYTTPSSQT
jgi:hypothetical protein